MILDLAILLWSQENEIVIADNHQLWWHFLDYSNDCFWMLQENLLFPEVNTCKKVGKRKFEITYQLIDHVDSWS